MGRRKKPGFFMLSDDGFYLSEYNHRIKTAECLYRSGVNLDDTAGCRIALTQDYFNSEVIDRHLNSSIMLAKALKNSD